MPRLESRGVPYLLCPVLPEASVFKGKVYLERWENIQRERDSRWWSEGSVLKEALPMPCPGLKNVSEDTNARSPC